MGNDEASPLLFVNSSRAAPCAREANELLSIKLTIDCELIIPVKGPYPRVLFMARIDNDDKASSWLVLTNETHLVQKPMNDYESSPSLIVKSFILAVCTATELI